MKILKMILDKTPMICLTLIATILIVGKLYIYFFDPFNQHVYQTAIINIAQAQSEKEMPMKLWVLTQVHEAGLNTEEAECIIKEESGWNKEAVGKTNDYGLWQINIQHKNEIAVSEMFDYKKATKWSIEKRLHDGNWGAWMVWPKCKQILKK